MVQPRTLGALAAFVVVVALAVLAVSTASDRQRNGVLDAPEAQPSSPTASTPSLPTVEPTLRTPQVGECRTATRRELDKQVRRTVPEACTGRHTLRTYAVVSYPDKLTDGVTTLADPSLDEFSRQTCQDALPEATGGTAEQRELSILDFLWFVPSDEEFADGARWFRCDLFARDGDRLATLPRGTDPVIGDTVPRRYQACATTGRVIVSCSRRHTYEPVALLRQGDADRRYPGVPSLIESETARCVRVVPRRTELTRAEGFEVFVRVPLRSEWSYRPGSRCFAAPAS